MSVNIKENGSLKKISGSSSWTGTRAEYEAIKDTIPVGSVVNITDDEDVKLVLPSDQQQVYSTDEIQIGTWIDGKPIYRKVFTELKATVPNDYTYYDFSEYNIDELINTNGFAYNIGSDYVISQPIPWITGAAKTIEISYNKNSKYLQIYCNQGTGEHDGYFYNAPLTIILEYTKTTD